VTRKTRHLLNVGICVLVLGHAIYRFIGRPEVASELWLGLVVAQGALAAFGIVWFWLRSRGASA
jgi:Co/Zn/Cd efflux system component